MTKILNIKKIVVLLFLLTTITNAKQIELSSNVISDNEKIISSRYMGYIKKVYVKEGAFVKKDQLLYEIDSSSLKSEEEQVLLNKEILENKFLNSKINFDRYDRLYKKELVSKYEFEIKQIEYKTLKTKLKIMNSKLKEIKQRYSYLKIKAPNDALVISKKIKEGELSHPGIQAMLLSDLSALVIKTKISESDLKHVYLNKKVQILIEAFNFKTSGKIISIVPNTNKNMNTFIIKIDFKYNKNVYPSMYANVIINTKE